MFKGLRTKIESEQRGQTSDAKSRNTRQGTPETRTAAIKADAERRASTQTASNRGESDPSSHAYASKPIPTIPTAIGANYTASANLKNDPGAGETSARHDETGMESLPSLIDKQIDLGDEEQHNQDADHLIGQITRLKEQLKAVMREKEESNEQNAQLYQLIEKLRRNLETERETKSSLQAKLDQLEKHLKEKTDNESYRVERTGANNVALSKSFNPDALAAEPNIPNDIEALRCEVVELQAQLAKKNRLLKIRQQNLTDIKRTLQREILDHGRTQEELNKLQKQLQISDHQQQQQRQQNADRSLATPQNGLNQTSLGDINAKLNLNQVSTGDKSQELGQSYGSQPSGVSSYAGEDTISLNTALGISGNVQFDRISCLSRSSASVDDFDSNDLQQSNHNKQVSHEYLRNVLYRYMTSTDHETTQHLVKAISVLMDFSPEQSAAIKSAMNSKSSWLRLK